MATYLGRSAWTTINASGAMLTGSELVGVAVHWPGTTQAAIGDPGQASIASRLRSYRDFHVNTRGWRDIGYNFAIDQGGRVWQLRTTIWHGNLVGAHCASASNPRANHKYVGVLLVLGASETPSAKMIAAFQDWYHNRFLPKWHGRTDVRGHGQVAGAQTSCPGSRARAAINDMIRKPSDGGTPTDGDDDMPTAKEIAKEVWDYYITKASNPDQKMTAKNFLAYPHMYILEILALMRATQKLTEAQRPLLEAAAQDQALSAEQVAEVAAACAAAVPEDLASDVADELGERISS